MDYVNDNVKHPLYDYAVQMYKQVAGTSTPRVVNHWHFMGADEFEEWVWLLEISYETMIEERREQIHLAPIS